MARLTDTQLIILSAASQRDDRGVELPANVKGEAARKVVDKLIRAGLLEEEQGAIVGRLLDDHAIRAAGARATRVQTKDGRPVNPRTMTVEEAIDAGLVFAGTPDDVFEQIKAFHTHVGGFAHLLMMGQGGTISHEDTVANLTLFSREVLPRLGELG